MLHPSGNYERDFPSTRSGFSTGTGRFVSVCGHQCEIIMLQTVCRSKEELEEQRKGWNEVCFLQPAVTF